jgi:hypothetical protein
VYGPVRTVVWQGSVGDCRPYADQTAIPDKYSRLNSVPYGARPARSSLRRYDLDFSWHSAEQ